MQRDTVCRERESRDSTKRSYQVRTEAARDFIYKQGKGVKSKGVEDLLGGKSVVPTFVSKYLRLTQKCDLSYPIECLC